LHSNHFTFVENENDANVKTGENAFLFLKKFKRFWTFITTTPLVWAVGLQCYSWSCWACAGGWLQYRL